MNDDYLRFNEQGLAEINPMAGYNAQQEFIDNYRNAQAEKTAQIGEQAHALGSDLTAQYGGLHGPSEYWLSRYQTPQTESRLAGLRAANQAQALNQLMKNDLEREAEKYNQAYRNYQKRARSYSTGGNPVTTTGNGDSKQGNVNFISLESLGRAGTVEPGLSSVYDTGTGNPTNTTVIAPEGVDENGNARAIILDNGTNKVVGNSEQDAGSDVGYLNAANAWAVKNGYSSWSDYIARHTDANGNVNIPSGRPSDIHQFDIQRYSMGY